MAGLFDLANAGLANVSGDKMGYALAPAINQIATSGLEQMMGGLGVKSKTQMVQGILSKIDMNDPNSMIMASSELMKMGMTAEAQQLMKAAQEAQLNVAKIGTEQKQGGMYEQQGGYYAGKNATDLEKQRMSGLTEIQKQQMKLKLDEMLGKEKLKLDSAKTSAEIAEIRTRMAKLQDERAKLQAETGYVGYTPDMKEAKRLSELDTKVNSGTATEQERYELSRLSANAGAVKQLDPTKLVPKTLEITAPYAKNQIATSGIVKVGNEVMQLMNLDDIQQARFIAQPEEFMKEWLSNQDNKTRLKNAKSRFSNAQVVQLLSQLSGSTSNEELKRFAEGLNNGYTNDAVFMKDMLMAMQGAKDELTFINDAVTYAEQNGSDPLKVQKYISDKTLERLSKTTQQASEMVGGDLLTPKRLELLKKHGK